MRRLVPLGLGLFLVMLAGCSFLAVGPQIDCGRWPEGDCRDAAALAVDQLPDDHPQIAAIRLDEMLACHPDWEGSCPPGAMLAFTERHFGASVWIDFGPGIEPFIIDVERTKPGDQLRAVPLVGSNLR